MQQLQVLLDVSGFCGITKIKGSFYCVLISNFDILVISCDFATMDLRSSKRNEHLRRLRGAMDSASDF